MESLQDRVQKIIHEEMEASGATGPWDMREIHVLPGSHIVIEYSSSQGTLSQLIIEYYFPLIREQKRLAHFTSLEKFKSIISTGTLRLYSLRKRINEQEFKTFSEDFGLVGYLDDSQGEPYYKTLMSDLFYTSFTNPNPADEPYMWNVFGASGAGIKILFDVSIEEDRAELRPVIYRTKNQAAGTLVKRLMDRIHAECGRRFIMRGISRIGAFYLPLGYSLEKEEETRLLIKSWGEGPVHDMVVRTGNDAYIPLPINNNVNSFCKLIVAEVQVGPNCNTLEIKEFLQNAGLSSVVVNKFA